MLVSVLMPVKDAADTVHRAVDSILQQTYPDFELIIVDDHSTDTTVAKLSAVADTRIKLLHNRGSGIAAALNTGLAQARGRFIARMDADDYALPQRLARQLHYALAHPEIGVVSCRVQHLSRHPKQQGYAHYIARINTILSPQEHYTSRFIDAPLAHPTAFFRASLAAAYGGYSTACLPEDFELWLRWLENGVRFAKLPEVLLHWADPPGRASRTHAHYREENFYRVKAGYFKRWWQQHHRQRQLWVWGYGKAVFAKVAPLLAAGVPVAGYIDLQERPGSSRQVRHYTFVRAGDHHFYLVYIGDREGKTAIADFFAQRAMQAGADYLFMA